MKQAALKSSESQNVILGTYTMSSEGMDIPDLDSIIFASQKSDIVQTIGRAAESSMTVIQFGILLIILCVFKAVHKTTRLLSTFEIPYTYLRSGRSSGSTARTFISAVGPATVSRCIRTAQKKSCSWWRKTHGFFTIWLKKKYVGMLYTYSHGHRIERNSKYWNRI